MNKQRNIAATFLKAAAVFATLATASFRTSDGSRVSVEEKGFSLNIPKGWEYRTDLPNLSLFAEAPKEKGVKYHRSIQVMVRNVPLSIDENTALLVEEELLKVFAQSDVSISDFHVRNHEIVELTNHSKAILYYTGMKLDGVELMQIHLLTSSDKRHYISTFTDLAEHFDKGTDSPILMTAWESLSSMEVQGNAPKRYESQMTALGIVGAFLGFLAAFGAIRWFRATMQYRKYATEMPDASDFADNKTRSGVSTHGTRAPTGSQFVSFQGSSEVTKASAHISVVAVDGDDSDEDDWNLEDTKSGNKAG